MYNITIAAKQEQHFDAIVVGSGISGGVAARELCLKGMKTLLLERGRPVEHIRDYPTALLKPWELKYRGHLTQAYQLANPVQSSGADEGNLHFFASDQEYPYIQEKSFNWYRGYQVGGRSLTWGRQCYRLSDLDFEANQKHGIAVDWPIRYHDLAPWYDYIESYIGVSGKKEGLSHLPDGNFLPPFELNCLEDHLANAIKNNYDNRLLTIARVANLTRGWSGRGPCLNRNLCSRGCPYGGYYSSNSASIPAAAMTGNLTLRPHSIVTEVLYDDHLGKATGVRVMDAETHDIKEFFARVIFLNASTINTAAILLQSRSERFPNGLGNDSGQVGHNLMDHHSSAGATGIFEGLKESYYKGRRPCGFLIPRFRNIPGSPVSNFLGGYNIQGIGSRMGWPESGAAKGFGQEFKKALLAPGPWSVWMAGWGECLPYYENRIMLDKEKKDQWGQPLIAIDFSYRENENKMMQDTMYTSEDMLIKAGFSAVEKFNYHKPPGSTVHEMGTARMGRDPETSVLNAFNQIHAVPNIFITDGSCMTSSACQNPSLTYMALTARACHYAVGLIKSNKL